VGQRYFALRGPDLHLYTADARPWLAASSARYDAIFVDTYRQPYIPFYLVTREFFASARAHLNRGGIVVVNVGHVPSSDSLEKVVSATLHAVFPYVLRDMVGPANSLVLASAQRLSSARIVGQISSLPAELHGLAQNVAARVGPALRGGAVFTDDRAPVEWLTDLSLLSYATSHR
jgi:hypothetical protein